MIESLAAIDSGWAAAIGTLILAFGSVTAVYLDRRRARKVDQKADAKEKAEAPAVELNATSKAAEALARAASQLILPFQSTIAQMSEEHAVMREQCRVSKAAEERCRTELADVRAELRMIKERVGIDPDEHPVSPT